MKANLMFRDRDFSVDIEGCYGKDVLIADLELKHILSAMSRGDATILNAGTAALLHPLQSVSEIQYRQDILKDAMDNPEVVREMYGICVETEKKRHGSWYWLSSRYLSGTFSSAVELLRIYTEMLMELRMIADKSIASMQSDGFNALFTMLQRELSDEYFIEVRRHIEELKARDGTLVSARFGNYLQGISYVFRRKRRAGFRGRWWFAPSFTIAERDDAGSTDLAKRRDRAINEATNALAQAAEHLEGFFDMLRLELAFYAGCLNLYDAVHSLGMPTCIPTVQPNEAHAREWTGLYDVSLALLKKTSVVGNELQLCEKKLYIITGANQGGKTTFLRSLGQAQLMAQCGMFVGAFAFIAPIRRQLFTHFKREEDVAMSSGKLDEELARMSDIADHLSPGCIVLFNESFSSTNEREGSEICAQITRALIENGVEVFSVTHLVTYAVSFNHNDAVQYLRAERLEDGKRTFKLMPGEPLDTAFGQDLYDRIFTE